MTNNGLASVSYLSVINGNELGSPAHFQCVPQLESILSANLPA